MAADSPEVCELMDLLHIDVEAEVTEVKPGREDALCSKNVLRKQRNWERQVAAKKRRRKEEKQKKKLKREQETGVTDQHVPKRVAKALSRQRLAAAAQGGGPRLCLDLSMTDRMSDKEVSRLAAQIRRLYGSNRKSPRPFNLFLTELTEESRLYAECVRINQGFLSYMLEIRAESCLHLFPSETLIYLSPDADEVLESVDPDKVYVLGGLVDESIQKRLSLWRAGELSVRAARLPIERFMVKRSNRKNFHSKILSINQVFDILLTFCDTGSWREALQAWFPQGKGYIVAPSPDHAPSHLATPPPADHTPPVDHAPSH